MLLVCNFVTHFGICQRFLSNQLVVTLKVRIHELDKAHHVDLQHSKFLQNSNICHLHGGTGDKANLERNNTKKAVHGTQFLFKLPLVMFETNG